MSGLEHKQKRENRPLQESRGRRHDRITAIDSYNGQVTVETTVFLSALGNTLVIGVGLTVVGSRD